MGAHLHWPTSCPAKLAVVYAAWAHALFGGLACPCPSAHACRAQWVVAMGGFAAQWRCGRMQGVSFEVGSGEKVGIVGRTGSGKSSLIVALFRLAEPHRGAIMLDGLNLLNMGLQARPLPRRASQTSQMQ